MYDIISKKGVDAMDKLKISILFWEERGPAGTKHDEVVEEVAGALSEGGHKV